MLEQLTDGRWHDQRTIVDVAARTVPPGVSFRRGERQRLHLRDRCDQHVTVDGARVRGDHDDSIRMGASETVRKCIVRAITDGHIERRYVKGKAQLRLARRISNAEKQVS